MGDEGTPLWIPRATGTCCRVPQAHGAWGCRGGGVGANRPRYRNRTPVPSRIADEARPHRIYCNNAHRCPGTGSLQDPVPRKGIWLPPLYRPNAVIRPALQAPLQWAIPRSTGRSWSGPEVSCSTALQPQRDPLVKSPENNCRTTRPGSSWFLGRWVLPTKAAPRIFAMPHGANLLMKLRAQGRAYDCRAGMTSRKRGLPALPCVPVCIRCMFSTLLWVFNHAPTRPFASGINQRPFKEGIIQTETLVPAHYTHYTRVLCGLEGVAMGLCCMATPAVACSGPQSPSLAPSGAGGAGVTSSFCADSGVWSSSERSSAPSSRRRRFCCCNLSS